MKKIILTLILLTGSPIFAMTTENEDLNEQLALEIIAQNTKKVEELLNEGANPNIKIGHDSALNFCQSKNLHKIFELLVNKIPDQNVYKHILSDCCINDKWKIFDILIKNGVDINEPVYEQGSNLAMHYYNYKSDDHYYDYARCKFYVYDNLISRGLNVNAIDNNGNNFLHIVLGHVPEMYGWSSEICKIIELFFFKGINIRKKNNAGQTPISLAAATQNQKVIKIFSKYDTFLRKKGLYKADEETNYTQAGLLYLKERSSCTIL